MEFIDIFLILLRVAAIIIPLYFIITKPLKEINENLKDLVIEIKRKNNEDKK